MYNHNRSFDHEPHHALTSKDNHYFDVSKKYTPKRFLGLFLMIAIGIFGILLATQTVSPTSIAQGEPTVTIRPLSNTSSSKLRFYYSVTGLEKDSTRTMYKSYIKYTFALNGGSCLTALQSDWRTSDPTYHVSGPTSSVSRIGYVVSGTMAIPLNHVPTNSNRVTLCLRIQYTINPFEGPPLRQTKYIIGKQSFNIQSSPNYSLRITQSGNTNTFTYHLEGDGLDSSIARQMSRSSIRYIIVEGTGGSNRGCPSVTSTSSWAMLGASSHLISPTHAPGRSIWGRLKIGLGLNPQKWRNPYLCLRVEHPTGSLYDSSTRRRSSEYTVGYVRFTKPSNNNNENNNNDDSQTQPRDTTAPIITTTVVSMNESRIEVRATSNEPVHWYKGIVGGLSSCTQQRVVTNAGSGAVGAALDRTRNQTYLRTQGISTSWNNRRVVCFKATDAAGNTAHVYESVSFNSQTQRSTPISITLTKLNSNNSSQLKFAYTLYNYPQGVNTNNIKQLLLHKIVSGNNCDNNVAWLQHDSNGVSHVSGPTYDNTRVHSGDEQSRVRGTIIMPVTNTQRGYASAYLCFKVSLIIGSVDKSLSITLDPLPRDNPDDGSQPQQRDPDDEEQRPVATVGITVRQTPNANGLQFNYTITGLQHDRSIGMSNIKYHVAGANQKASSAASVCGNSWKAMNTASQFHMSDEDNRKAGHTIVSLTNSNGQREAYYNQYRHYYACIRVNHPGTNNLLGNEYTLGSHPVDIKKPVLHSKADLSSYGNPGLVKVKMSANDDVDWVTGVVSNASDCASKTIAITRDTPPRNANQPHTFSQQFTSNLINKYVCFKVQDHWGNSNYDASHRILDLSSPTPQDYPVVTVTQGGNGQRVFTATANEPITTWQHVVLDLNEICSENGLNNKTLNSGSTFTVSDNQIANYNKKQICFQATDSDDGLNGYNRLKIDLNPTVAIKHNGQFVYQAYVTDEPVDDNHWRHRVLNSATCNAQSFNNSQLGAVSLVKTGSLFVVAANKRDDYHNQYICFEIKDNDNLKGYKSMQMDLPEITDGHIPIVHITQAENVFKAYLSPDQAADWQYVVLDNSNACQASGFGDTAQTGSSLTVSEQLQLTYHGQVLCFQATLSDGQKVYGFMLMNFAGLSQPVIKVTRTEMTFVAHISPNMSADWRYLILDNNQCDSDVFTAKAQLVQTGNSVTVAAENKAEYHNKKYLCFKAALEDGRILYKSVLMDFESDTDSSGGEPPETVINTGILDDYQFSRLFGFVLITAAILGTTRIMLVKKYKRIY